DRVWTCGATGCEQDQPTRHRILTELRHGARVCPRSLAVVTTTRLAILGGGPAGNTCATVAATLGADVTLVERDVVGGAAHLWDCIPSKALIATGGELSELRRARLMGLQASGELDIDALRE